MSGGSPEAADRGVGATPGLVLLEVVRAIGAPFRGARRLWRRSIQLRTVAISVLLSSAALLAVGTYMSFSIGQGLFNERLSQVLAESQRAAEQAQDAFGTLTSTDPNSVDTTVLQVAGRIRSTPGLTGYAFLRAPDQPGPITLPSTVAPGYTRTLVSQGLSEAVERAGSGTHWQSVALTKAAGPVDPAVMVGTTVQVTGGAEYELYLLYDIVDVQATLDFLQRTLLIGGVVLVLLIGAVTLLVTRLVVQPVRQAALVSEQIAAGRLDKRIPEHGEDVVATLAHSFNRMADGLQRQITQLANLSRVQQRFVSDVSHELRTPLTTIRLAADVLHDRRDRFDAPTKRSTELLHAQVRRFETLLADLLEISRMDAHAAELVAEPVNLVDVVREGIDSLGGLAEQTGTEVRLEAPGGHTEIEVDARRVARVVRNLLANAIEHGEGRPVTATVDSSADTVALGVRDHGVGMTAAQATRVFDRFWRADPSRQRRVGGTGLGLAISLEDAQLHGGALEVWSAPHEGAHFVLTLPRIAGEPMGPSPIPLVPADAAPAGPARAPGGRLRRRERVRA